MKTGLLIALISAALLGGASVLAGQREVFVPIVGRPCSYSTALADSKFPESYVETKRYWASGFFDGAHAALGMGPVRSSVSFTYARLQNYCGQHPNTTLQDAMLALVEEDRPTNSANNTSGTSGPPQVVFRPPVFRLDPPTWVLWSYASEWAIVTADSVDTQSKVPINLSYFETVANCTTVRSWLAGLPKGPAVSSINVSFQCYPSSFDPRGKK